jgi:hypothetical protein
MGLVKLNRDILTEIPHLITVMPLTLLGKEAILELVDRRKTRFLNFALLSMTFDVVVITDKTAASIARALSSILRNTSISWVARTASIELLSRLHEKYSTCRSLYHLHPLSRAIGRSVMASIN